MSLKSVVVSYETVLSEKNSAAIPTAVGPRFFKFTSADYYLSTFHTNPSERDCHAPRPVENEVNVFTCQLNMSSEMMLWRVPFAKSKGHSVGHRYKPITPTNYECPID